jgi:hypothetical protein
MKVQAKDLAFAVAEGVPRPARVYRRFRFDILCWMIGSSKDK